MADMGEEFYSIIKLISGEEIFALISIDENYEDSVIILQNPVVIKMINHNGNHLIKIKPWIDLSSEDVFMIKHDRVITMTESTDEKLIEIYNNFLTNDQIDTYKPFGQVGVSSEMGYVSSVDNARKKLEELFKIIKPKES
jgi:hypothetical protein